MTHPTLSTDEVELINDKERYILHILALLPASRQNVPVFWCADNDMALEREQRGVRKAKASAAQPHVAKQPEVRTGFSRQKSHSLVEPQAKALKPVCVALRGGRAGLSSSAGRAGLHSPEQQEQAWG